MWPDVGVKSSQNVSKVAQKVALAGFIYMVTFFKRAPNKSPNIFMQYVTEKLKNSQSGQTDKEACLIRVTRCSNESSPIFSLQKL